MSDHQPEHHDDDEQAEADRQTERETARDTATDQHEPDFSRLRLARASLDNAFPQQ